MAPARTNGRRAQRSQGTRKQQPHQLDAQPQPQSPLPPPVQQQPPPPPPSPPVDQDDEKLFLDPMSGQPLALYIEKDVDNRDALIEQVIKYGGVVSPGYSGVMYILVDPLKDSGQNLYRQYAGKKNKMVLNAHWILHCIRDKTLHGFATQWAGCKLTGKETENAASAPPPPPPVPAPPPAQPAGPFTSAPLTSRNYPYPMYPPNVYGHPNAQPPGVQPVHPSTLPAVLPPPPHPANIQQQPNGVPPQQPPPSTSSPGQPQGAVIMAPQTVNGHPMPVTASTVDPLHPLPQQQPPRPEAHGQTPPQPPPQHAYQPYAPHTPIPQDGSAPPPGWQPAPLPPPPPHHLQHGQPPPPPPGYRYDYPREWAYPPPGSGATTPHQPPPPGAMVPHPHPEYEYQYPREHEQPHPQPQWVPGPPPEYYAQYPQHPQQYYPQEHPMPEAGPSNAPEPSREATPARGRKRHRSHPQPAPPASTLVVNRRNPPARSPTPPSRVIKSTYGGNLFTSEDVLYLKKYIDYCQEQGLVLSLREICERIAVKAPHHTFYSWRRYCNKHQIRLGGYAMELDIDDQDDMPPEGEEMPQQQPEPEPMQEEMVQDGPPIAEIPNQPPPPVPGVHPGSVAAAKQRAAGDLERTRSPTPPRALFRSTTGKGVAFTDEDVTFLVRFLEYRTRQHDGKVDMVAFWKDVANKAPHHSRASWMKFYRRHKHELEHKEGDDPLPPPPPKKMRYTKSDDVLLAKFFANRPEGTTDKVFQEFGRMHPHHPWKGWQEHHRIHKAKIDHLIGKLSTGEEIEEAEEAE